MMYRAESLTHSSTAIPACSPPFPYATEFEAFAFQDADDYSLEEFEGIAATFEEQWFGAGKDMVGGVVGWVGGWQAV